MTLPNKFDDSLICAGDKSSPGFGTCLGDSGAPMLTDFLDRKSGEILYKLLGVLHGGIVACDNSEYPAIYTRISTPKIYKWIEEKALNPIKDPVNIVDSNPIKKAEKIEKIVSPEIMSGPNSISEPKPNSDQQTLIISMSSLFGVILLVILGLTLSFYKRRQNTAKTGETELKEIKAQDKQKPFQDSNELKEFSSGVIKEWSDINIKKEIGEGNFGKVYKGFLHLNEVQRIEVAIKEAHSQDAKEEMLQEAKSMIKVSKHDHIVNFQGVCVENDSVYLLLEFCSLGPIMGAYFYLVFYNFLQ